MANPAPASGNLFWCDLETTGLDPRVGKILEVAMIATTGNLDIVAEDLFLIDPVDLAGTIARADPRVQTMHAENGLWADLAIGPCVPFQDAAGRVIRFIEANGCTGSDSKSPLCGSTPSFDRGFLAVHFPSVLARLSYRHIDVSTIHELAAAWYDPALRHEGAGPAEHRALADIRFSIERLRWYRRHVFNPSSRIVRQGPAV